MTPQTWASLIAIVMSAVGSLVVYRFNRLLDAREARAERLETRVQAIELAIAGDLPNKEDMGQLVTRLDNLANTLDRVKDMVTRLDEREKVRHERD